MRVFLRSLWHIGCLTVAGPGWGKGAVLFGTVLALDMLGVWFGVQLIAWNKVFYDALSAMDGPVALRQVGVFFALAGASAGTWLVANWLKQDLSMHWRGRLSERMLAAWTEGKAYWHLRSGFCADPVDNPDQRVAEDCKAFVSKLLLLTLGLTSSVVALFSYLSILWGLSGFPLVVSILGQEITIPYYMVWSAFLYVALSSVLTHVLGRKLRALYFTQERREADFRHALLQMRERAEQIARAGGESAERRRLSRLFVALRVNWRDVIRQEFLMGLFTRPYQQTVLRIPTFLALPAYFAGSVTLGGLMQLASAFSNVTTTLSWFIFRYRDLAEFAAIIDRLSALLRATTAPSSLSDAPKGIARDDSLDGKLRLENLRLMTPEGVALPAVGLATISPGARVWISGPSGVGKSTLLAAIIGLWPWGEGRISVPGGKWLVLPHGGALFPEGLAASLTYPHPPESFDRRDLARVLGQVGLLNRVHLLDGPGDVALAGLSQGECQRIAIARALLLKPDVLVLDEATSALDVPTEALMLETLRQTLPGTTILCVAHRPPEALGVTQHLVLQGGRAANPEVSAA